MSLYRKYRPQDFDSLMGQDHISEILRGALKNNRVSHAYLFTGPRGTGKTSSARILARAINCLDLRDSGPCNQCEICLSALNESLTDMVEIDAASHGLVDDARALVEQARFMPTLARKKIYIIDEVHMLSKSAFNALLKIIEEPPEHVHFILATTEAHKVLETIKSRCQRFDFHLADEEMLLSSLRNVCVSEKVAADEAALMIVAQYARGSFRDALSLLEQVIGLEKLSVESVRKSLGISEQDSIDSFVSYLFEGNKAKALEIIQAIHEQGNDLYQICQLILEKLRIHLFRNEDKRCLLWIDIFFNALDQLRDSFIPTLPLELAVYKCLHEFKTEVKQDIRSEEISDKKMPELVNNTVEHSYALGFDPNLFISSLKHSSLRSLIKQSSLQVIGNKLNILAKSQFELDKIRESSNQFDLAEALKLMGLTDLQFSFGVSEKNEINLPGSGGISDNEVRSIFK